MESSMKPRNDQEKRKMALKLRLGNGGGIGAVVLLGGALATAALASAFVARRSSGKNRHRSPRPDISQRKKGQDFVLLDQSSQLHENIPSEVTKDVEADNDDGLLVSTDQNSTQVEKPSVEEIKGDNMKLENDAISDGSAVIKDGFPLSDEKSSFEPQNMKDEDDEFKNQLAKEVIIPNEISKESEENIKEGCAGEREHSDGEIDEIGLNEATIAITHEIQPREEESIVANYDQEKIEMTKVDKNALEGVRSGEMEREEMGGFGSDDGEISEEGCSVEAIDGTKVDLGVTGLELRTVLPGFNGHVVEHENVTGDEEKSAFSTEIVGLVKEDVAMEGSQEDGEEFIEDNKLVEEEQEKCDQADEKIESIEGKEDNISCEINGEIASLLHPSTEKQFGLAMLKEEVITPEVAKEDGPSEEVAESLVMMSQDEIAAQFVVSDENALERKVEDTKEDGPNEEAAESLEMNQDETTAQFPVHQPKDENALGRKVGDTNEDGPNEEVTKSLEMNQDESTVQFVIDQPNDENAPGGNVKNEVEEERIIYPENAIVLKEEITNEQVGEISEVNPEETTVQENDLGRNVENEVAKECIIQPENTEVMKEEVASEEVAESLEVNQDKNIVQSVVRQPNDENAPGGIVENEEAEEELIISPKNTEFTKEEVPNEEIAEIPELNQNSTILQFVVCQSKDDKEYAIKNNENEVKEELISPEDTEVSNENETPMQVDVFQPIDKEDDAMKSIPNEVNQKELIISSGENEVAKENDPNEGVVSESLQMNQENSIEKIAENLDEAKDDLLVEMRRDEEEENGEDDDIKDLDAEIASSDEVENGSIETGDSYTESELDAVWPAESLEETQEVKRIDQELEGKIQEDKASKGDEYDDNQIICEDYSSFGKEKADKSVMKKYAMGMCNRSDLTRRKLVFGILSVVSSLSCSWFFDLSFVKLSLIVFLTMAIVINGY